MNPMASIEERIIKDIKIFGENIKKAEKLNLTDSERNVVELSKMYASDSRAWLKKKDFYTSFSSIAYAHGLLDAIFKIKNKEEK